MCPSEPRPPLNQDFLNLQTMLQIVRAECSVLLDMVERLHAANGQTQIEGEPIRDWFHGKAFDRMFEEIQRMSEHDPELAQGILQTIRSKSDQASSSN